MNTAVTTYLVYLLISLALTVWVGRTLHANGALFLVDVFRGNTELAKAVNHLLVVGFYLINLGFVSLTLRISDPPSSAQGSIESLSIKIGSVLLVLGILHLGNVFVFNRMRMNAGRPPSPQRAAWQQPLPTGPA
ncbi:MAG TPA: hypothetical protein VLL08_33485 [Kineosporiaceae bacterium]|nr:hypothetical protein [Kineosporiaceae bacterium]